MNYEDEKHQPIINPLIYMYFIIVIGLHLIPGGASLNKMHAGPIRADYLLHSILFLPWMFLFYFRLHRKLSSGRCLSGWRLETKNLDLRQGLIWMGLGIGFGIGAEGIHYWLPHRVFNPVDALFNVLGILVGAVCLGIWEFLKSEKPPG